MKYLLIFLSLSILIAAQKKPAKKPSKNTVKKPAKKTKKPKKTKLPDLIAASQNKWYQKYKTQENIPPLEEMKINTSKEPDLTEGFVDLYNKKNLDGWQKFVGDAPFVAKGDIIEGSVAPGPSTYLSTDKEYSNFIFTCEVKWLEDGNTGVQFRSKLIEGKTQLVSGPQVELEEKSKKRGWSGAIYGQDCGGYYYPLWLKKHEKIRKAIDYDKFNRITIQAIDGEVKTWINGIPAAFWVSDKHPKGFFSLQIHSGKTGKIHFRNIKVKEL